MSLTEHRVREVSTFAAVGVAATLTHLVAAWIFHAAGLGPQMANFLGWVSAVGVSFLGHARLTFRVGGPLAAYLPKFVFVSAVAYAVSAIVVSGATATGASFPVALALVGLTVPPASYLAQRFLVFRAVSAGRDRLILVPLLAGGAIFLWFRTALVNHDVAWYLVAGRQWIDGARLYTDLSEVNPPLAFYLIRAALHLGDVLALGPAASLAAFTGGLVAISTAWVGRSLPQDVRSPVLIQFVFAVALVIPFLGHFGQREHLMVILLAPWVAAALFTDDPLRGRGAIARGIVGGIGVCLKPYFLVYPLALTVTEIIRTRSLRPILAPANLAMGSVGVLYVAFVAVVHPEYLGTVVPDARLVYGAVTLPVGLQVQNIWPLATALAGLVLLAGRAGIFGQRALALYLAAILAYVLQGNGFTYHAAPIHALALIGLAVLALRRPGPLRLASVTAVALILGQALVEGGYRNPLSARLADRFETLSLAPKRLLVWSPSLLPAFPLVLDQRADWAGHAGSLWLLPGTLDLAMAEGGDADPRRPVLDRQRDLMARDLARCPDVVILDRVMPFQSQPLDLRRFAGPRIARDLDRDYTLLDSGERFDILTRRTPCA